MKQCITLPVFLFKQFVYEGGRFILAFLFFLTVLPAFSQQDSPIMVLVHTIDDEFPVQGAELGTLFADYGVESHTQLVPNAVVPSNRNFYAIKLDNSANYESFATDLENTALFDNVELLYNHQTMQNPCEDVSTCTNPVTTNDPASPENDYLETMNLPCAWSITTGNPAISVAVVDVFMDYTHQDLFNKIVYINDACQPALAPCNHGYMSAGSVAAIPDNEQCVAGAGYNTTVAFYCADMDDCTYGNPMLGLCEAYEDGYKILNASFSWTGLNSDLVEEMTGNGVNIVVSAGNSNHHAIRNIPGVIHTSRVDDCGNFVPYDGVTPSDANLAAYDIFVPTQDLPRLEEDNGCGNVYGFVGGTSIAAPHIAGIIALMRDVNPCLSAADIENILKITSSDRLPANADEPGDEYFGKIHNGIVDAYEAVLMAQNFDFPDRFTINNNTIDGVEMITGNWIIKTGADVTVTGTMYFNTESKIIVERGARLRIDGGTLTVNPNCGNYWSGIKVEGNANLSQPFVDATLQNPNQAGILVLRNEGIIEYASTAISTVNKHYPWPELEDYFGGVVYAENANFLNNNRGAQFQRYGVGALRDKSEFIDCVFDGQANGVTIWANDGITFKGNLFNNFKRRGIQALDSEIIVEDGNIFNGIFDGGVDFSTGLDIVSSAPGLNSSTIGNIDSSPNEFNDGYYGIRVTANGNTDQLRIRNNRFTGGTYGININGATFFHILQNEFNEYETGIRIWAGGDYPNLQRYNTIENCQVGTLVVYENEGYQFLDNCFNDNTEQDFVLTGKSATPGTIRNDQGSEEISAGNIFTKGTTQEVWIFDDTNPFNYHVLIDEPFDSDRWPTGESQCVVLNDANDQSPDNCGTEGLLPPDGGGVYDTPDAYASLHSSIQNLQQEVNTGSDTPDNLNHLLALKLAMIRHHAVNTTTNELLSYFENEEDFLVKTNLYGHLVKTGTNEQAATYLEEISIDEGTELTGERADFIEVQELNLKRLKEGLWFRLKKEEEKMLKKVAYKNRPLDGYARGVWFAIHGEHLPIEEFAGFSASMVVDNEIEEVSTRFSSGPNPVQNLYEINMPDNENEGRLIVRNIQGKIVYQEQFLENTVNLQFSTAMFQTGVYFLSVDAQGEMIYQTKFIKH